MFVQIFPSKTKLCRVNKHASLVPVSLRATPAPPAAGSEVCWRIMLAQQIVKKVGRKFFFNNVCCCSSQRWKEASICFCVCRGQRPLEQFELFRSFVTGSEGMFS